MDIAKISTNFEALMSNPPKLIDHIFKANDIRGIVDEEITPDVYFLVGLSFAFDMHKAGIKQVVVGRDGRLSSPSLTLALLEGLKAGGAQIIDIGLVPSPVLYFATFALKTGTGMIVTGSHNPANYNGIKMMLGGKTLTFEKIQSLKHRIESKQFYKGQGSISTLDILPRYVDTVVNNVDIKRRLKVVIDCGHGAASVIAPQLYDVLGVDLVPLYCEADGRFPVHHPDPSKPENLADLIQAVKKHHADCGLAFDGDGDRLGVVTPEGEIIWPDRQLMLYASSVLETQPGASIIYDVKCTQHLAPWIKDRAGVPVMHNTGHALIKSKMQALNAPLAGEMSGHFFFKDRWYGFDDALYTGARLLEILSQRNQSASEVFHELPNSVNTPEIQIPINESEKFLIIDKLKALNPFKEARCITIDGLRIEFKDGWGLIRASNTSPCLVIRFEADTQQRLNDIMSQFKELLLKVKPNLDVSLLS